MSTPAMDGLERTTSLTGTASVETVSEVVTIAGEPSWTSSRHVACCFIVSSNFFRNSVTLAGPCRFLKEKKVRKLRFKIKTESIIRGKQFHYIFIPSFSNLSKRSWRVHRFSNDFFTCWGELQLIKIYLKITTKYLVQLIILYDHFEFYHAASAN